MREKGGGERRERRGKRGKIRRRRGRKRRENKEGEMWKLTCKTGRVLEVSFDQDCNITQRSADEDMYITAPAQLGARTMYTQQSQSHSFSGLQVASVSTTQPYCTTTTPTSTL